MNGMNQLRPVELRLMDSGPIAQECLERAMAIKPDDNLVRYNVACTYSLLGETDGAIK